MISMKKRSIYILLPTVICFILIAGCTKLKDKSYTDIVAEQFTPTSDDVAALLGTSYGSWRAVLNLGRTYWTVQEESGDAFVKACKANMSFCEDVHMFQHSHTWKTDEAAFADIWRTAFEGVTNCNRVLYQIASNEIPLEDDAKTKLTSELRALRASYYYVLCDVFGNVPIVDRYDVPAGFLPEQHTRKEVFNFMVKEITESLPNLSDERNTTTYGRFNNKWAAYALLAKIYLNAGVWAGAPEWDKCIAACDAIINSGLYELEPIQANCFKVHNENSIENIWMIPYGGTKYGFRSNVHIFALPAEAQQVYDLQVPGWGGLVAIPQFINTYDPEDKRLTGGAWLRGQLISSSGQMIYVSRGDSVGKPFNIVNTVPSITHSEDMHGYRVIKYEVQKGEHPGYMENDAPMARYAEILMMKAECLMRLGRPGAGALVTQVRMRNFDNPAKALVTDEQLLETSSYDYGLRDTYPGSPYYGTTHETEPIMYGRFLDELGWEFAGEAHRRTDMIRFGVYNTRSRLSFKATGQKYTDLGPIPLREMNTNSNLKQNPGY